MVHGKQELPLAIGKLWSWLETWKDDNGGVHGYVVYHHRDNLKILSPDTWAQSISILGLLELYRATKTRKWLNLAQGLSHYLVKTYIPRLKIYQNSNFDRKPLGRPALDANALPSYALLETAKLSPKSDEAKLFQEIAKDNIMNYLLQNWDESVGAFTSIYHGVSAHIHNKNSMAIMALISLFELTGLSELFDVYASKTGRFIVSTQVKKGTFAGAFPYTDNDRNYRTTYSLITCIGLLKLYQKTKDAIFLESVKSALHHLSGFLDHGTGLICHYHRVGYPQWVLDTVLYLMVANRLSKEGYEVINETDKILDNVLTRQYTSGGFPLSIGFEDLWYKKRLPSRPEIRRWRDLLPTPGINSWIFWALCDLLPSGSSLPDIEISFPHIIVSDREETEGPYKIIENKDQVTFETVNVTRVVGIFNKKAEVADFSLLKERGDYWKTIDSIMRYPEPLRRLILTIPNIFH